jgi:hypothetical protein
LGSSQSKARTKEAQVQCKATSRTSGPDEGLLEKQKEGSKDRLGSVVPALDWNIVSVVVGAIGIAIGYYLYRRSIKAPIPSYAIHPLRVRIVDKTQMTAPGLQVLHNGVPLDAKNVTCATLYFWNSGRAPIHQSDVLIPYSINIDKSATLLECLTISVTRDVCGFIISPETTGNQVSLNFNIIEPQDGIQVQLIYAGEPNATITVSGTCEGANEPKRKDKALMVTDNYGFLIVVTMILAISVTIVYLLPATKNVLPYPVRLILFFALPVGTAMLMIPLMKWLPGFLARKTAIQTLIRKSSAPRPR